VITGVKKYWILWFAFLAAPGSGFLRFDGIPFSSKTEFAVLAVSVVGALLPTARLTLKKFVQGGDGLNGQLATLILACAIVVKLFTFVLLPLGEGFEACYRSIYAPLPSGKCEKSFESPFLTNDLINVQGSITRMEPHIDFGSLITDPNSPNGASATSWKLPFANDYPRLSAPWLDRLPFTAHFGTMVSVKARSVLPIEYIGELKVDVDGKIYSGISYKKLETLWVPVQSGKNSLRIIYKFADDNTSVVPDIAPVIQGPWAHLFVGEPISLKEAKSNLQVLIKGWVVNSEQKSAPKFVELRNGSGALVGRFATYARPDLAGFFPDRPLTNSGFDLTILADSLAPGVTKLTLVDPVGGTPIANIALDFDPSLGKLQATPMMIGEVGRGSAFDSVMTQSKNRSPLAPGRPIEPTKLQQALLLLIDSFVLVLLAAVSTAGVWLLGKRRRELPIVVAGITTASALATYSLPIPSAIAGIPLFAASALSITSLLILLRKKPSALLLASLVPLTILASKPILSMNRLYNGLFDAPWWRFPLWYGRGGDWFVTQGYARTIFVENSLRGGENLFYFQPGVRYFVFLQHLLLGENDVLLQMLIAIGLLTLIVIVARNVLSTIADTPRQVAVYFFVAVAFPMVMSFEMIGFAVVQASEYPTWLLTFLIFGIVMTGKITPRSAIALSALCALIPQFRPNQIFGAICLFILLQFEVAEGTTKLQILHRIRMVIVFGVVLSLSLFHNLYYAASFTLFSSSGALNADFTFVELINVLHDSEFRNFVIDKLRIALWWRNVGVNTTQLSFWTFQLIWLLALIRAVIVRSTSIRIWIALALPFAYLVPLLPYKYESYWPRHIVIIQIAFALSGLFAINRLGPIRRHENHQDIEVTPNSSV
jgi:hypothetical protein